MKDKNQPVITERDITARLDRVVKNLVPASDSTTPRKSRNTDIGISGVMGHYHSSKLSKIASLVILESNPQLRRAIEILSGLIVNPDGSDKTELHYDATVPTVEGETKVTPDEVKDVVNYLETHFTDNVGIHKKLSSMVYDILSTDGADVEVYIPAALTEKLLTTGNESEIKNHTFFPTSTDKTKSTFGNYISISTDPDTLIKDVVYGTYGKQVGNERDKFKKKGKINIDKIMGSRRVLKESPLVEITKGDVKSSQFSSFVKDVPAEACVPVVNGSDIENPVAYYLLLDDTGHFIKVNEAVDFEKELRLASSKSNDGTNSIMANIASDFGLGKVNAVKSDAVNAVRLYDAFAEKLEAEMLTAIKNGNYGDSYTLDEDNHLAEIMLHRALRKKRTKMILVPASMVSYIAFDRNNSGVGVSLVMKAKLLSVLQSVLFYATYMGYLDQAIPKELIETTFDEADTNQEQTREMILQELDTSGNEVFSHAASNPATLMNKLRRRGVQMKFNNTQVGDLPTMDINRELIRRERNELDTDFLEMLNNQVTQSTGVSPQWVSDSYTPNFKAEIVRDNELIRRQVQRSVDTLTEGLTERVIKTVLNDPILTDSCLNKLKGESDERQRKLERILMHFNVSLPQPPELGVDLNNEALQDYLDTLDLILEAIINEGIIDGVEEMDYGKIESLRANMRAYFAVQFVSRNTMYRDIVDTLRDEDQLMDIVKGEGEQAKSIIGAAGEMAKFILRQDKKTKSKLDKVRESGTEEVTPATTETTVETPSSTPVDDPGTGDLPDIPEL